MLLTAIVKSKLITRAQSWTPDCQVLDWRGHEPDYGEGRVPHPQE
jgi:hypothetical protein